MGTVGWKCHQIFTDTEPLSAWGFTTLHKIVIGLHGRSLFDALTDRVILKDINAQDAKGRTPLWWAVDHKLPSDPICKQPLYDIDLANVGLLPRVQALLDAGADSNIADFDGESRFRQAMLSNWLNIPMIELLSLYGGRLTWQNRSKMTSLHIAVRWHDSPKLLEVLSTAPDWKKNIDARGGT